MNESEHTGTRPDPAAADCSGYVGVDRAAAVTVTPYRPPTPRAPERDEHDAPRA
jgi:hypothetical protein